jgi:hypothetical protein
MRLCRRFVLLTIGLTHLPLAAAATQTLYMAAGVGPTPVLQGRSGNRHSFGVIGYQGPKGVGLRLSGTETVSRLWLSADLTIQRRLGVLRPYGLLGGGMVVDLGESDLLLTAGAGLRAQLHGLMFVFIEARVHGIPGSTTATSRTILPITIGLGLGK